MFKFKSIPFDIRHYFLAATLHFLPCQKLETFLFVTFFVQFFKLCFFFVFFLYIIGIALFKYNVKSISRSYLGIYSDYIGRVYFI